MIIYMFTLLLMNDVCDGAASAYKYHVKVTSETVMRDYVAAEDDPLVGLLCPRGFYIHSLSYDIHSKSGRATVGDKQTVVSINDVKDKIATLANSQSPCKTLLRCLGYQACIFKFSIEFCRNDPIPGEAKVIHINSECLKDSHIKLISDFGAKKRWLKVLFVTHSSISSQQQLVTRNQANLDKLQFYFNELSEKHVFHGICPNTSLAAYSSGYRGQCDVPVSVRSSREELWRVLARAVNPECRRQLTQVYCAYKLNTKGQCAPPMFIDTQAEDDEWEFGFQSLPAAGWRPVLDNFLQINHYKHSSLLPGRFGFAILGYKEPSLLLEMIKSMYNENHYYVIHIDKRAGEMQQAMEHLIHSWNVKNIRVLPTSRSFITSWGSYDIVRAELECMEELLRMGVWDFFINLSYADLPLRSISDISAALAPYRGVNFMSVLKRRTTKPDSSGKYKSSAYAYHNCDGYLYQVVLKGAYPQDSDVVMTTQWVIVSYAFARYILSDVGRRELRSQQFNLQTLSIPDEGYFQSLLLSSTYKSTYVNCSPRYVNAMFQSDIGTMSRKMNETDLRGQGPANLPDESIPFLKTASWKNLFARKFATARNNRARQFAIGWSGVGFGSESRKVISGDTITAISREVVKLYAETKSDITLTFPSVTSWSVLPKLLPTNSACQHVHSVINNQHTAMNSLVEYSLVMDVRATSVQEPTEIVDIRASIRPLSGVKCFTNGHLRAVLVTTIDRRAENIFKTPLPFESAGASQLFIHFFMEQKSLDNQFDAHYLQQQNGHYYLPLNVQIIKPDQSFFCQRTFTIGWKPIYSLAGSTNVFVERVIVNCGNMISGNWTILISQDKVRNARVYTANVYLRNKNKPISTRDLSRLWPVADIATLPLEEYFYEVSTRSVPENNSEKSNERNFVHNKTATEHDTTHCIERVKNDSIIISFILVILLGVLSTYTLSKESLKSNIFRIFVHYLFLIVVQIIVPLILLFMDCDQNV